MAFGKDKMIVIHKDVPTFGQHDLSYWDNYINSEFIDLLFQGFMKIKNKDFSRYLEIVGNGKSDVKLEDLFEVNYKKK